MVRKCYSDNMSGPSDLQASSVHFKQSRLVNCNNKRIETNKDVADSPKNRLIGKCFEQPHCVHKGQSEPHLFIFDDDIYVYKPCQPITKVSTVALHDNVIGLPSYESIDLRFPTEESSSNICSWSTHKIGNDRDSCNFSRTLISTCSCSDADEKEFSTEKCFEMMSCSVQTENPLLISIGLQAAIKRDDDCCCSDPGVKGFDTNLIKNFLEKNETFAKSEKELPFNLIDLHADITLEDIQEKMLQNVSLKIYIPKMLNTIQSLEENLLKTKNKAEAKEILLEELQSHLTSAVKEVELKDTALSNLEKKLDMLRKESASLKQKIIDVNSELQCALDDVEYLKMLNNNLTLKVSVKDEKINEILSEQKSLQDQKRALLTQLDVQEDALENIKKDVDYFRQKADSCSVQVEQQSQIIKNLQEALVKSKRAFEITQQRIATTDTLSSLNLESKTKTSSKGSIVEI